MSPRRVRVILGILCALAIGYFLFTTWNAYAFPSTKSRLAQTVGITLLLFTILGTDLILFALSVGRVLDQMTHLLDGVVRILTESGQTPRLEPREHTAEMKDLRKEVGYLKSQLNFLLKVLPIGIGVIAILVALR